MLKGFQLLTLQPSYVVRTFNYSYQASPFKRFHLPPFKGSLPCVMVHLTKPTRPTKDSHERLEIANVRTCANVHTDRNKLDRRHVVFNCFFALL